MERAVIVLGQNVSEELALKRCVDATVFAADQGAAYCLRHHIPMDVIVGDFDSVSQQEKDALLESGARIVELPHHKDVTDTAEALSHCKEFDEVRILGGIAGNRIEHFIANIDLLRLRPNVASMEDDDSYITVLSNTSVFFSKEESEYVSIFALEDAIVSLKGFEYPLDHYSLSRGDPLGVSNEILDDVGEISVHEGLLLVIVHKTAFCP